MNYDDNLNKKNVVLISPRFFGYEEKIMGELRDMGANVQWYNDRPSESFLIKALLRFNYPLLSNFLVRSHHNKIISNIKINSVDYLFLIDVEAVSELFISRVKKINPEVKTYIYMWDSIKAKKRALLLIDMVDKYYSFDPQDAKQNIKIKFLPLFYSDKSLDKKTCDYKFDICFIGTYHSDRAHIIREVEKQSKALGYKTYFFLYSPSRLLFLLKWLSHTLYRRERRLPFNRVSFKPLEAEQVARIRGSSRIMIDIEHPGQTGLTIRIFEVLAQNRKIITTNNSIVGYEFYSKHNIEVVDRAHPVIDPSFLSSGFEKNNDFDKFSLRSWLHEIFN